MLKVTEEQARWCNEHRAACDCREFRFQEGEKLLKRAGRALLNGLPDEDWATLLAEISRHLGGEGLE